MSRIAIITDPTVGGTFIAWSIHWLSGQKNYFNVRQNSYVDLVTDPVNGLNSHQFLANQAVTLEDINKFLEVLPSSDTQHIYFHQLVNTGKYSNSKILSETKTGIELAAKACDKVIVIKKHRQYHLYHCSLHRRTNTHNKFLDGSMYVNNDHNVVLDDIIDFFFKENLNVWESQNLTNTWDKREFIALNFRPFEGQYLEDFHLFDFDHYDIPAHTCWLTLDEHIKDLLKYCNIKIDNSRFEHWLVIYNQWKKLHEDRIKFCQSFDTIIEDILKGNNVDLTEFNLDILREATIQHTLIYKHNLNLKTWQLEKFVNTQQLHNLLEPNIHPLSS